MLVRLKPLLLTVSASVLLAVFVSSVLSRLATFHKHEIGVSVTRTDSFDDIEFPAISVCTWHFDFQRLRDDLGFPRNPFQPQGYSWRREPAIAYEYVDLGYLNMSHFLHNYYPMLDQLFVNSKTQNLKYFFGCKVGDILCEVRPEDLTHWSGETNGTMEIEVICHKTLK